MLNVPFSIPPHIRRNYTGMIRKLLALGAAGIATAATTVLPAAAWIGGPGCGCGPCGLGWSLAGWWGPLAGYPWGMFTPLCGCW